MTQDRVPPTPTQAVPLRNQRSIDFIEALLDKLSARAWVAASTAPKRIEAGGFYTPERISLMPDDQRHHMSAALYRVGAPSNEKKHILAVPFVVIDDVGRMGPGRTTLITSPNAKVDEEAFILMPEPSWRIETSPGNFQFGYCFDPPLTLPEAEKVHAALKASPDFAPGLHAVGQYFRLPSGRNTKPDRGDFETRLVSLGGTYTLETWRAQAVPLSFSAKTSSRIALPKDVETCSPETLRKILKLLPNIDPVEAVYDMRRGTLPTSTRDYMDRETWVGIAHAIRNSGGDREDWLYWNNLPGQRDQTPGEPERVWDELPPDSINDVGTLRIHIGNIHGPDSNEYWTAGELTAQEAVKGVFDEIPEEPGLAPAADMLGTVWLPPDPKKIPPREWLYGTAYIRRYVSGLVAPGGSGKTSLSFVEALAMASGKDLLGVQPRIPLRVAIWNGEDPKQELDRRLIAIMMHYGLTASDIGDRLLIKSARDVKADKDRLIVGKMVEGQVKIQRPVMDRVIDQLRRDKVDVLDVDPFITSHQVPENSNDAIDAVVKEWAHVAEVTNTSINLVHHLRKMDLASQEVTADDARGASAYRDALRVLRLVASMSKDMAKKYAITNPRAYFRVVDGKASMAPAATGDEWYRFVSVSLQNGVPFPADGSPGIPDDQVGVVTSWAVPAMPTATTGLVDRDIQRVQRAVSAGAYRMNDQSGDWVGHVVGRVLGLDVTNAVQKKRVRAIIDDWLSQGWLKITKRKDKKSNIREHVEVGTIWIEPEEVFENVEFPHPEQGEEKGEEN